MIVQHLNKIAFHFSFDYIFSQLYFDLIQIIANKIFPPALYSWGAVVVPLARFGCEKEPLFWFKDNVENC